MIKQGPSNGWELKTRRILEAQLPEYDVDPHIRLSNVVKGKIQETHEMSQYEIDFTIRDKKTGHVICAIELDGPTHNEENRKRCDANKNCWLNEAKIPLHRIQKPEEAYSIRKKLGLADNLNYFHRSQPAFMKSKQKNPLTKYISRLIAIFAIVGLLIWTLNSIALKTLSNIGKNTIAQTQAAEKKVNAQQPKYERVLIKGKSARECTNSNVITNETINCTKDHYEMVLISGTQ